MAYPIQWLDATFRSRAKTEQLLRPDLESGLITEHDYHLASAFLPASHRYWPYYYSILTGGTAAGYTRFYRKPPMSINRSVIISTVAAFLGSVYGQFRRAKAHWNFTKALDDPAAFSQALQNVNQRTGGTTPLTWTLQRAKEVPQREDVHGNNTSQNPDAWAPDADQGASAVTVASGSILKPTQQPASESTSKSHSRWEDIRTANARNAAQSSSWDVLRQSHEREQIPSDNQPETPYADSSRAQEQARFDAMLEAERKLSGQ
ncbi:hypothetical protein BKA93DRAFT_793771 [Sparassis latifolia]|uniref:Uncharacterized protein n=1 Tax=Sparassis crispa TaxID=139825 RepID=A0A401G7T6_9APHY|nr:predicted protein [Sparassis crispa]GBE78231.1 predicted protein [Sparassis crispa]